MVLFAAREQRRVEQALLRFEEASFGLRAKNSPIAERMSAMMLIFTSSDVDELKDECKEFVLSITKTAGIIDMISLLGSYINTWFVKEIVTALCTEAHLSEAREIVAIYEVKLKSYIDNFVVAEDRLAFYRDTNNELGNLVKAMRLSLQNSFLHAYVDCCDGGKLALEEVARLVVVRITSLKQAIESWKRMVEFHMSVDLAALLYRRIGEEPISMYDMPNQELRDMVRYYSTTFVYLKGHSFNSLYEVMFVHYKRTRRCFTARNDASLSYPLLRADTAVVS